MFRSQDDVLTAGETWKAGDDREGVAMQEAANGTNTPPIRRQIGWSGASAISFGIAIVEFVKEILLGGTVTHATYECSVYLVGGLILGLVALVANRRASRRTHSHLHKQKSGSGWTGL